MRRTPFTEQHLIDARLLSKRYLLESDTHDHSVNGSSNNGSPVTPYIDSTDLTDRTYSDIMKIIAGLLVGTKYYSLI